tara:strand:+ start:126 stop:347 length:222 start_codon:yes stop_codon:yes gene_type:complete
MVNKDINFPLIFNTNKSDWFNRSCFMKNSKLLLLTLTLVTIIGLSACAPFFHGGPGGGQRLANEQLNTHTINN